MKIDIIDKFLKEEVNVFRIVMSFIEYEKNEQKLKELHELLNINVKFCSFWRDFIRYKSVIVSYFLYPNKEKSCDITFKETNKNVTCRMYLNHQELLDKFEISDEIKKIAYENKIIIFDEDIQKGLDVLKEGIINDKYKESDTLYKCTVCGCESPVGRCWERKQEYRLTKNNGGVE